jgi:D-glycero-D-manno-heptose 1,7-bisphosphate phosphatase
LTKNRALFLDRDGVINVDHGYVSKVENFEFVDGVFEVLKKYQKLGYLLIVVTNQSGIGRGYYSSKDFKIVTSYKLKELKKRGVIIDEVYHCPHDPDSGCGCRKPSPSMLLEAKKKFDIDMNSSWMIGDKKSDIDAGYNAGVKNTILISPECYDKKGAKYCVNSISEIVDIIKS